MYIILISIIVTSVLSLIFGAILSFISFHFKSKKKTIVEQINNILPQSQCAQCGYIGCRQYADAIINGENINKCAPGGEYLMIKIAELINIEPQPLNPKFKMLNSLHDIARINEIICIGCTKCILSCPVDAIIGAPQVMHTVLSEVCTGCGLCIDQCPMNCIKMIPIAINTSTWKWNFLPFPIQNFSIEKHD